MSPPNSLPSFLDTYTPSTLHTPSLTTIEPRPAFGGSEAEYCDRLRGPPGPPKPQQMTVKFQLKTEVKNL